MSTPGEPDIYAELGIQRAVNAMGNVTLLGGSILSPKVQAAMAEMAACFYVHRKKVTIGGYSSGGELAYQYAFKNAMQFAGILIEHSGIPNQNLPKNSAWKLNVAATGGTNDGDYPPSRFNGDWSLLRGLGFPVETQTLPLTHDGNSDEWDQFLIPKMAQAKWVAP